MFQKKGVDTRPLKYRLPENPGILNSARTSVRRNGLVEGHTYVVSRLNFTALELSLFRRKKQRSKKIKTLYNCI